MISGVLIYGKNLRDARIPFAGDYRRYTVNGQAEANDLLRGENIHFILARGREGIEFYRESRGLAAFIPKILIRDDIAMPEIKKYIRERLIDFYIFYPVDADSLDITARQATELFRLRQENLRLSLELTGVRNRVNQIVREKTTDLLRSNKRLEEANQLKDKLFSIISHDLMTPIFSFRIFLEVITRLKDDLSPEKFRNYGIKVQGYVQSVTELLENLLNWSLSQTGAIAVERTTVSMNKIIENNCRIFGLIAEHKQVKIEIVEFPEQLEVEADENILNLVIRNLISNAIKFTPERGKVYIRSVKNGKDAVITIEDSGVGIQPGLVKQLFSESALYTSRGVRNEKGAGLGLKICKEFIEKLNGRIWVESAEGKGSVFSVSLPLAS